MQDRLVWLLEHFELTASVVQAGPLACRASHQGRLGTGHLHVLQDGEIRVREGRERARLVREPSAVLYMNRQSHDISPTDKDVSMVCAEFEFGLGTGNPLSKALPEAVVMPLCRLPSLGAILERLFTEAAEQHCGRQAILDRLMEVALILILRDLMDEKRLEVGLLAGLADAKLAKAINAMHADPGAGWTLDSLAHAAGMSRARFAIRFRDVVGSTPGAYLNEWRIGLAQALLLKGRPVTEIGEAVGYGSASALSRAFSARCGMAPSAWLKRSRREGST